MAHDPPSDEPEQVPELEPYDEDEIDENPVLNPGSTA